MVEDIWTSRKVDKLKKLWDQGFSTDEIAKKIGVSKNSVVGKAHRIGLKSRMSSIKSKIKVEYSKDEYVNAIRNVFKYLERIEYKNDDHDLLKFESRLNLLSQKFYNIDLTIEELKESYEILKNIKIIIDESENRKDEIDDDFNFINDYDLSNDEERETLFEQTQLLLNLLDYAKKEASKRAEEKLEQVTEEVKERVEKIEKTIDESDKAEQDLKEKISWRGSLWRWIKHLGRQSWSLRFGGYLLFFLGLILLSCLLSWLHNIHFLEKIYEIDSWVKLSARWGMMFAIAFVPFALMNRGLKEISLSNQIHDFEKRYNEILRKLNDIKDPSVKNEALVEIVKTLASDPIFKKQIVQKNVSDEALGLVKKILPLVEKDSK